MKYQIMIEFETDRELTRDECELLLGHCVLQIEEPWDENQEDMNVRMSGVRGHVLRGSTGCAYATFGDPVISETRGEIERARRDRDELYMPFLKWIDDTFDTSQPWGGYAWGATGEDARVVPRYATNEDFRVTWEADVVLVGWYSTEVDDNDVIGLFEFKMTEIETAKEVILFVEGSDKPIKEALLDASKDERFSNSLEAFYE